MMPKILASGLLSLTVLAAASTAGAAEFGVTDHLAPTQVVVVRTAPPVEVVERPGPAPSREHIWVRGHWRWDGHRYLWDGGHWEARRVGHSWVPGHWVHARGGWYWVDGHWQRMG